MTGYPLDYVLDKLSLDQVILFYNYGMEFEETRATILVNQITDVVLAMFGKKKPGRGSKENKVGNKPDLKKFNTLYGNKIKRPNGK